MHIKHIKVLQPFSIEITHKYKYMFHYSFFPSVTHTLLQDSLIFSQPTTKVSNPI